MRRQQSNIVVFDGSKLSLTDIAALPKDHPTREQYFALANQRAREAARDHDAEFKREVLAALEREERGEREGKPRGAGLPESVLLILERELKIM